MFVFYNRSHKELTHFYYDSAPFAKGYLKHDKDDEYLINQCFSTFVRPRPGKLFFFKDEGPVPTNLLVNIFPIFFKFIQ